MSDAINLLVHVARDGAPGGIPPDDVFAGGVGMGASGTGAGPGGGCGLGGGGAAPPPLGISSPPPGASVSGLPILPSHGAVWHVFSPSDTDTLRRVLPQLLPPGALFPSSFLLDASVYLDASLLDNLEAVAGVRPYVILQGEGDAVLLPAGCAHQVCNIRSCVKVRRCVREPGGKGGEAPKGSEGAAGQASEHAGGRRGGADTRPSLRTRTHGPTS